MSIASCARVTYRGRTVTVSASDSEPLAESAADPRPDALGRATDEAAVLLGARGAFLLLDDRATGGAAGGLRVTGGAALAKADVRRWEGAVRGRRRHDGIVARALADGRVLATDDYPADAAFRPDAAELRAVRALGARSVVVAPLVVERPIGVLAAYSDQPAAFSARDVAVLATIADHAAGTVAKNRLIEQLDRSRAELARRAENERALREIAARFASFTDPGALLQHVVDEANRLVDGDGAVLDVLQPGTRILAWAYDSGLSARFGPKDIDEYTLPIGVGLTGRAVELRQVLVAGDDLVEEFPPSPESDRFFERTGFRSMIAAPIGDEASPLGALEVYSTRPHAFDADHAALVGALADHAAVALVTARRMADLTASQAEVARRADAERSLREIAARLTALREPSTIIQQTVDEAARLLGADGARIDLIEPTIQLLRGAYMSGRAFLTEQQPPKTTH